MRTGCNIGRGSAASLSPPAYRVTMVSKDNDRILPSCAFLVKEEVSHRRIVGPADVGPLAGLGRKCAGYQPLSRKPPWTADSLSFELELSTRTGHKAWRGTCGKELSAAVIQLRENNDEGDWGTLLRSRKDPDRNRLASLFPADSGTWMLKAPL